MAALRKEKPPVFIGTWGAFFDRIDGPFFKPVQAGFHG